jgi:hypothetical protein
MNARKEADEQNRSNRADASQAAERNRREAEQAGQRTAEQAAEVTAQTTEAVADIGRTNAETAQQNLRSGLEIASQVTERSLQAFTRVMGLPSKDVEDANRQASRNVQTILSCGTVLAHAFQDVSRELANRAQDRVQKNIDGMNRLMRCRSPQDAIVIQSDLVRGGLEDFIQGSKRVSELILGVADEAMDKITVQQKETTAQGQRAH